MIRYTLEIYRTEEDVAPFQVWIEGLCDPKAKTKLTARLLRAQSGNFGDWREIKGSKGLLELRDHSGPGYRIYFSIAGQTIILLLAGSTKRDQQRVIDRAADYLSDYRRRSGQ